MGRAQCNTLPPYLFLTKPSPESLDQEVQVLKLVIRTSVLKMEIVAIYSVTSNCTLKTKPSIKQLF